MSDYERISITIEPELLERLDGAVAHRGHGNRSEMVRDLIRAELTQAADPEAIVTASLTVVFDHSKRALSERLVDHAHDHHDLVQSTLHVHLDHDRCMEVSVLRGRRADLEHYADHLRALKGVLRGELVVAASA